MIASRRVAAQATVADTASRVRRISWAQPDSPPRVFGTVDVDVGPIHGPRSHNCRHERPSAERRPGGPTSSHPICPETSWSRRGTTEVVGDGDGWVRCSLGHRHWGRFGAAGLLVTHRTRVLLQHRSPNTHGGDSWALPGGARDSHEDPLTAALREAGEETSLDTSTLTPGASWIDEHGGWSYTTIIAHSSTGADVTPANWESTEVRWWPVAEVTDLHLHHGFAAAWPALQELLT